jgi:hypothetical protein
MAAPKTVKKLGGAIPSASDLAAAAYDPPAVPLDDGTVMQAVNQLQNTLNELIKHYNAHQHAALNAAPSTELHTGAGASAQNLFTAS